MSTEVDNKATFVVFGAGGVGHHRGAMPASATNSGLYVRHDRTLQPLKMIGTLEAPVIVYNNPFLSFQIEECEQVIAGGGQLIIDIDDDLRALLGKDDLMAEFDEAAVIRQEQLMQAASLVTCSTQHIADTLRKRLGVETMVCPNAIDLERFNVRKFPRNKEVTVIGWAGGVGHMEAFESIVPAIVSVLDARDDVAFVGLGSPKPNVLPSSLLGKHADSPRVADAGFLGLYEYPAIMCGFHIGLCPAIDNEFYKGKSDNKFLEQAASYVATIGQEPTYNAIENGREETGILLPAGASPDEWRDCIMELIGDPKRRYTMTRRARKYVAQNRTLTQTAPMWQAAIDRALEKA